MASPLDEKFIVHEHALNKTFPVRELTDKALERHIGIMRNTHSEVCQQLKALELPKSIYEMIEQYSGLNAMVSAMCYEQERRSKMLFKLLS